MGKEKQFVYKSTLKTRFGLTDSLIRKLGRPGKTCPNPHYRTGPPAGLYSVERVEKFAAAHRAEIDDAAAKRDRRKEAAAKAVQTKTARTVAIAMDAELEFCQLPAKHEHIKRLAYDHAIDRHGANAYEPGPAGIAAFVRHNYTNYEEILERFHGQVGGGDAYVALRERLDAQVDKWIESRYGKPREPQSPVNADGTPLSQAQTTSTPSTAESTTPTATLRLTQAEP